MHPNALLELATELIHRTLQFRHPADGVVSTFFREHRALGGRERAVLAETTYEVLRRKPLYQHLARSGRGELERRLAVLAWTGNAGLLRAALSDAERVWLEQVARVDRAALPAALRHNLPAWLAARLEAALGEGRVDPPDPSGGALGDGVGDGLGDGAGDAFGAEFWPLVEALDRPAGLDLRVNRTKAAREEVQAALAAAGIDATPTPYAPFGLRVAGRPPLTKLDVYTRGEVEVQDEGSQLLALLTGARRGEMVADFCAGAGGKTLALGAEMRNTGRLYAFDTSGHRLAALKPRLARSGLSNVYPIQLAHERDDRLKRLAAKIDRVLVDAPCSGLGTLRRNPDLKWRQTPASIDVLRTQQAAILASAARLVKPGGRLVYATCSLLEDENEAIAEAFGSEHGESFAPLLAAEALAQAHVSDAAALVRGRHLRLWPHRHGTDGFFAALWQRK